MGIQQWIGMCHGGSAKSGGSMSPGAVRPLKHVAKGEKASVQ